MNRIIQEVQNVQQDQTDDLQRLGKMVLCGFLTGILRDQDGEQQLGVLVIEFSFLWWSMTAGQLAANNRTGVITEAASGVVCCLLLAMEVCLSWQLDWFGSADIWIYVLLLGLSTGIPILQIISKCFKKLNEWRLRRRQNNRNHLPAEQELENINNRDIR